MKRKKNKYQKEQRVNIIVTENKQGMIDINLSFYPSLVNGKEAFEKLPIKARQLQNVGADIGKYVLARLAKNNDGVISGKN